ncbi:MAG TPA: rRNA pseudouridine synthase [Ignavibacteriales bacterium]|nr:rRNA pseudouridine synthase [Ignavibacteriales bacterium]
MTRLNKFIADSGVTSRRKAEELILQGRVTVNNKTITKLAFTINPEEDDVSVDGEKIKPAEHVYYLLNKPKGVVTTTDDEKKRLTVTDIVKTKQKIFPVGRLDYNTTGVLILTNDGEFAQKLLHPRNNIIREYEVKLDKNLEPEHENALLKGVFIDGTRGKFIAIKYGKKKDRKNITVQCTEGRNHFVKKMFSTINYTVEKLHRSSFAGIIPDIPIGAYRKLTQDEIKKLSK